MPCIINFLELCFPNPENFTFSSVPCLRRAASIEEEYEAAGGEVLLDNEDNDGWLATHGKPKGLSCFILFMFSGHSN